MQRYYKNYPRICVVIMKEATKFQEGWLHYGLGIEHITFPTWSK